MLLFVDVWNKKSDNMIIFLLFSAKNQVVSSRIVVPKAVICIAKGETTLR